MLGLVDSFFSFVGTGYDLMDSYNGRAISSVVPRLSHFTISCLPGNLS